MEGGCEQHIAVGGLERHVDAFNLVVDLDGPLHQFLELVFGVLVLGQGSGLAILLVDLETGVLVVGEVVHDLL